MIPFSSINIVEASTDTLIRQQTSVGWGTILMSRNGTLYSIFERIPHDIWSSYSYDNGTTWATITDLSFGAMGERPGVTIDTMDNIYVVFFDSAIGLRYAKYTTSTNTWGSAITICAGNDITHVSSSVDGLNNIHVVYDNGTANKIQYRKYTNATATWSSATDIDVGTPTHDVKEPTIAIGNNNYVYVAWVNNSKIHYKTYTGAWNAKVNLTNSATRIYSFPDIVVSPDNNIHVVFNNDTDTQIEYRKYSSSWGANTKLGTYGALPVDYSFPTIGVKSNNDIVVVWMLLYGAVKYNIYSGGSWGGSTSLGISIGVQCNLMSSRFPSFYGTSTNIPRRGFAFTYIGGGDINQVRYYGSTDLTWNTTSHSTTTSAATSITTGAATLNGQLTTGAFCTVGFWYNTAWTRSTAPGTNVSISGEHNSIYSFSTNIIMLTPGEYYHSRAWSINSSSYNKKFVKATESYFITIPNKPTSITTGNTTGNTLEIRWVNSTIGTGTNRSTMVRYSTVDYPTLRTEGTLLYNGSFYRSYLTPWIPSTQYYFSAWTYVNDSHNSSRRMAWSSDYRTMTYTTASAPSGLTVASFNSTQVVLTWTKGLNNTVLVRNTTGVYPATPWKGTTVYNGTLETYTDTGLDNTKKQYYRAWDFGTGFSAGNTSVSTYLRPGVPTTVTYKIMSGKQFINITWVNGTATKKTIVRRSPTIQPSTPQSGTEVYNGTLKFYNMTSGLNQPYYFSLWSFNTTTGLFSDSVYLTWYCAWINVYNESSGLAISSYSILFSNNSGSQVYSASGASNPYIINASGLPKGLGCSIQVSKTGYNTRVFTENIVLTGNIYLNFYLVPVSNSNVYLIQVINSNNQPLEGVDVTVSKYINATVGYENVSSGLTDGNGQMSCFLNVSNIYKFHLVKDGYKSQYADWIPDTEIFTHTFMMEYEDVIPPPAYVYAEEVTFEGYVDRVTRILYLNFTDNLDQTIGTTIHIWEINETGFKVLFHTDIRLGDNSFQLTVPMINESNTYQVVLTHNGTIFGTQIRTLVFDRIPFYTPPDVNTLFHDILGESCPFLFIDIVMVCIVIAIFYYTDSRDAGKMMIVLGVICLFISSVLAFRTALVYQVNGVIPILVMIIGILSEWGKK